MNLLELKNLLLRKTDEELENATIVSSISVGCCGDYEELEVDDVDLESYKKELWLHVRYLNTVAGDESCRQMASTKQKSKEYLEGKK